MRFSLSVLAATLFLQLSPAQAAPALTVDELVARHIEARGGAARLAAMKSLRITGKAIFGEGDFALEAAWGQAQKRPAAIRNEITVQGLTSVHAYDGKQAWAAEPFGGRRDPFLSPPDDAKNLAQDADLDGPLVGWREKGHKVDYLGTEDVDGTPAHKLRVSLKDGDTVYVFLDTDYFLEIREIVERHQRGTERVSETDLGSYAQVNGVWMPFSIETGRKGGPKTARYTVERADADAELDDAMFHLPAQGTRVGRAIVAPAGPAPEVKVVAPKPPSGAKAAAPTLDAGVLSGLRARNIGSATMSGRIAALAARNEKDGKTTLYVGAASGGVWKSFDGGTTFKPVFDHEKVQSIGALALDPGAPGTIWVGTGEGWTRNSTSVGDGIYKSTDGGETWTNMGLPNSERIVRIVVHPKDSNTVFACVPGKLWSDSPDRGLYKTTDGGKTWDLVLTGDNLSTGCSSVTLDPKNPDVMLAGLWDFRRKGWTFRSGGNGPDAQSGSGLFRSTDGGAHWTALEEKSNAGLPPKPWGRVETVIAPSDSRVVYSFIESEHSALYRSADGGATWEKRDNSQNMVWRPFYFGHLVVDPTNPDRLFKPDLGLIQSEDGGKSFGSSGGGSHGDCHDIWIDPQNPKHVIIGDDGGLFISWDGGNRYWKGNNLPVSQFYHVSVDDKDPYNVYGGLQDNSNWVAPSANGGGISNAQWQNVGGGDGFWVFVDPTDPDGIYSESQGGYIQRFDRKTQSSRDLQPKAGYHEKLRFNWNTPIHLSPTQKGTMYMGAQFLFRTRDRGDTWERISPDLTTNDPEKQKQEESGGITVDNSSAEMHTTIYTISESPKDAKTLWVGTDDGNVQLTRDAGKTWTNLTRNVKGLPAASWVSWIEASRYEAGTAYAAFDRHTFGDLTPYVYRTTDFGKTWSRIVSAQQGVRGYAHVIKEDTVKPGLLFLGTEFGLFISIDAGKTWAEFKGSTFPSVAVRDLAVQQRDGDLVLATHGRGMWIIDDLTPLRALSVATLQHDVAFLEGRPVQQRMGMSGGWVEGDATFVGDNPPSGAVITYYQRTRHLFGPIKLEVLAPDGKVIDTVTPGKRRGLNRVTWTMQVKPPRVPRAAQVAFGASQGPRVLPGTYSVRLTKGAQVVESKLPIELDRRAPYDLAARKAQYDAAMRMHALFGEMSALVDRLDAASGAVEQRKKALQGQGDLAARLDALAEAVAGLKKKVVATKEGGAITGEERIREHSDILYGALLGWEGKPAQYQLERIAALTRELGDVKAELDSAVTRQARALDAELGRLKLEPIPLDAGQRAEEDLPAQATEAALSCFHDPVACEPRAGVSAQRRE